MWLLSGRIAGALLALAVGAELARGADPTVATVGSRTITQAELEKHVRPKMIEMENERYEVMRGGVEELVEVALLEQEAKALGVTSEALEKKEITDKAKKPTDAEIQETYDENKEQIGDQPLDAVKPQIVAYLTTVNQRARRDEYITSLKAKYKTVITLKAPVVDVGTGGRPSRGGGANAPITIIEFSDYECPFCKRAEETVKEVLRQYPDKVRFVYRDFPLEEAHPNARPAAEAAHCAQAQGKFWEYHDRLFAQQSLSPEKLKSIAGEVGLDQAKFNQCLEKRDTKASVDQDMTDASNAGVTGTPTFFVNGRVVSGARPFADFKQIIDEELAQK